MKRFALLLCLASLPLLAAEKPAPNRPNFLIILADDLGFSDLGCYGSEIATPNLDGLAANGLRFTDFYNTARCWPSRAALMTGYYAQQVRRDQVPGIGSGNGGTRPAWAPLVTEFLRPLGYRTYHSGKWHIDGQPLKNGFDHSFQIASGGESGYFAPGGTTEDGQPVPATTNYYATTAIAEHAVKCLREHADQFPGQPFFHYLAFTSPHFPLQAPAADIAKYRERYRVGWNTIAQERYARLKKSGIVRNDLPAMEVEIGPPYNFPDALKKLGAGEVNRPFPWADLTEAQREFQAAKMAIHAAMVDRMDQEIGRVLAQLRQMGALENTLILFASDNGASAEIMVRGLGHDPAAPMGSEATFLCLGPGWSSSSNTPFRRHKTWVHEGGIATPLIVHWPKGLRDRGELRHTPAHLVDVVPTILDIVETRKPAEIAGEQVPPAPGRSLLPVFGRDVPSLHDTLWWAHEGNAALRAGDWKIVKDKQGAWELYNLKKDRGESHNLAAQDPKKLQELEALWEKQWQETKALATAGAPTPPSKRQKQ